MQPSVAAPLTRAAEESHPRRCRRPLPDILVFHNNLLHILMIFQKNKKIISAFMDHLHSFSAASFEPRVSIGALARLAFQRSTSGSMSSGGGSSSSIAAATEDPFVVNLWKSKNHGDYTPWMCIIS